MSNKKKNYTCPLVAGYYFHIYNRTNNKELLFRNEEERIRFLTQYETYVHPYVDTFTYCLLGTHFHIMIRVKSLEEITEIITKIPKQERTKAMHTFLETPVEERCVSKVVVGQFTRLFTSYAMKFNGKTRRGNLFYRPFKRLAVANELHFTYLIYYIHANPERHRLTNDFKNYKWSSFRALCSTFSTKLVRQEVLDWFGGRAAFLDFHQEIQDLKVIETLIIEDD